MIFINYDLMYQKCRNCKDKKYVDWKKSDDENIFLCFRNMSFNDFKEKISENICLYCYSEFQIQKIDYTQYSIYKIE